MYTLNRGITVLEVVMYTALLSILLITLTHGTYPLLKTLYAIDEQSVRDMDVLFFNTKLEYLLSNATVHTPHPGKNGDILSFTAHDGSSYTIAVTDGRLTVIRDGEPPALILGPHPITTFVVSHSADDIPAVTLILSLNDTPYPPHTFFYTLP